VLRHITALFKDFRIIIYENDSKDNTKIILKNWNSTNPDKIHISINNIDSTKTIPSAKTNSSVNPFFSYIRINKMATLRNMYMEYIEQQGWNADYLIVVDLDVSQLYLGPILTSFRTEREWDAVCAFGYSTSPKLRKRYHDTYALTEWGSEKEPQTEAIIKRNADKYGKLCSTNDWIRIASGFGGLAIYKFEAVKGLRYKVFENANKRVEVKCEHFSLYRQMNERGYNHFYINPAMILRYQDLTYCIIWNYVCRYLMTIQSWLINTTIKKLIYPLMTLGKVERD